MPLAPLGDPEKALGGGALDSNPLPRQATSAGFARARAETATRATLAAATTVAASFVVLQWRLSLAAGRSEWAMP